MMRVSKLMQDIAAIFPIFASLHLICQKYEFMNAR